MEHQFFEKVKKSLKFIIGVSIFLFIYVFVLPAVAKLIPRSYEENLVEYNIDATPLFYSESKEALNSYYFLELSKQ